MSGDTKSGGESHSFVDDRTEFDRGFQDGIASAYRTVKTWSNARLDRLEPGKGKTMRLEIESAQIKLLYQLRYHLPTQFYPEIWKPLTQSGQS